MEKATKLRVYGPSSALKKLPKGNAAALRHTKQGVPMSLLCGLYVELEALHSTSLET